MGSWVRIIDCQHEDRPSVHDQALGSVWACDCGNLFEIVQTSTRKAYLPNRYGRPATATREWKELTDEEVTEFYWGDDQ